MIITSLQQVFKGAMSHYFRVFRGNLKLITKLKLENGNMEILY